MSLRQSAIEEDEHAPGEGAAQISVYFCRGCGKALPLGFRGQFHPQCLAADKRRRTQEKRRQERQMIHAAIAKLRCSDCGAPVCAQRRDLNASTDAAVKLHGTIRDVQMTDDGPTRRA